MADPDVTSRVGSVLLASLQPNSDARKAALTATVAAMKPEDLARLTEAAAYHRLVGAVHLALKDVPGVDPTVTARIAHAYREGISAQLRLIGGLREATSTLDAAAIAWLAVKGPLLSHFFYAERGQRLYFDVDVVVPKRSFRDAVEALESKSWRIADQNWPLIRREHAGQLKLVKRPPDSIDLHWHLLYGRELRREFPVSMDELFERRRTVDVGPLRLPTLDPADTLIHLTMHACHEGGDRLVWLKDIEQVIANDTPDWNAVVHRARAWRVNLLVGSMLLRSKRELDARVPQDTLSQLIPSRAWRRTLAAADRLSPPHRSTGKGTPARLVARSTRATIRQTLMTSAVGGADAFWRALSRRHAAEPWSRRDQWREDPSDAQSLLHKSGTTADRAAFLESVSGRG